MLIMESGGKKYKLRLRTAVKNNQAPDVENYFRSKLAIPIDVDRAIFI